jgi:hypothetical protein
MKSMTLAGFRSEVEVITGERASNIRQAYISKFIDVSRPGYQKHIAIMREYRDGAYYSGYLWEYLRRWERIAEKDLYDAMAPATDVYAFWDLHSSDRILIPDYWKFPRDAVLSGTYSIIVRGRGWLPEDLYLCSVDMSKSVVLTHESDPEGAQLIACACPNDGQD